MEFRLSGAKKKKIFERSGYPRDSEAFHKSMKRTDEIDGVAVCISGRHRKHAAASYELDKRISGKSGVQFAIRSVSKSKVSASV